MKLNNHQHHFQPVNSPPPLPPRRKRLDTGCSNLQRSYTSPESDYLVKKRWNIFDVFNKGKKVETKKRDKIPPQPKELQLLKNKRNSFSSPDLTHFYCPADGSFTHFDYGNCSFDKSNISSSNSYELENVCEEDDLEAGDIDVDNENGINISHNIRANFEPPINHDISRVNLVGCGFTLNDSSSAKSSPTMSPPGYLEMRPGKGFDMKKVEDLDKQLMQNDILYRLKYSFNSPITYKRENDYDSPPSPPVASHQQDQHQIQSQSAEKSVHESHYVPMNVGTKFSPKNSPKNTQPHQRCTHEENVYVPMRRINNHVPALVIQPPQNNDNVILSSSPVQTFETVDSRVCSENVAMSSSSHENNVSRNKRNSVDDKIASYYPNYDIPARIRHTQHVRSNTTENVITSRKSKTPEPESKTLAMPIPSRCKSKRFGSFNTKSYSNSFNNDDNNNNSFQSRKDELTKMKFATIARITSPPKHKSSCDDLVNESNDSIKKSGSISPGSIKRITTFSKLKKLDFSPLREKISNALRKHNSGSC
jgi:hypothetical protein